MNYENATKFNKKLFLEFMEQLNKKNNLTIEQEEGELIYKLTDNNNKISMSAKTGLYLNTNAGLKKSNRRQYLTIVLSNTEKFSCPSYTFRIIFEGLVCSKYQDYFTYEQSIECLNRLDYYKMDNYEINHINGDPLDCSFTNLEVCTSYINKVHSSLMHYIYYYFPDLIIRYNNNESNMFKDNIGISAKQIEVFNKTNKIKITPLRKSNNKYNYKLTYNDVKYILKYFNKLA